MPIYDTEAILRRINDLIERSEGFWDVTEVANLGGFYSGSAADIAVGTDRTVYTTTHTDWGPITADGIDAARSPFVTNVTYTLPDYANVRYEISDNGTFTITFKNLDEEEPKVAPGLEDIEDVI